MRLSAAYRPLFCGLSGDELVCPSEAGVSTTRSLRDARDVQRKEVRAAGYSLAAAARVWTNGASRAAVVVAIRNLPRSYFRLRPSLCLPFRRPRPVSLTPRPRANARVSNMTPRDTSRQAEAAQIERLRQAGPEARLAMAADMSDAVRELALAAIRRRHPDFDAQRVGQLLAEHLHGRSAGPRRPTR